MQLMAFGVQDIVAKEVPHRLPSLLVYSGAGCSVRHTGRQRTPAWAPGSLSAKASPGKTPLLPKS
jgi:hypothetical protein